MDTPSPLAPTKGSTVETICDVRHWTDRLFSFRTTRPAAFRFRSGEFVMLGLAGDDARPIMRAYSMASPSWDESLEFFSIKVPDGPLTSRLQHIGPSDTLLLGRKPTGTLVLDALTPGKRLYLISSGTGIAPFVSLIRDPETYDKYDHIILTHTCRHRAELDYGIDRVGQLSADPLIGEFASRLTHYTSLTRQDHPVTGRITDLIRSGKFFADLGVPALDPAGDRAMICGSNAMIEEVSDLLRSGGLAEGSNAAPGGFVIEKAFVG